MGRRLTDRALGCVAQAAAGRRGTQDQCQTLPKVDWNALCSGSCSALLGGHAPGSPILLCEGPPFVISPTPCNLEVTSRKPLATEAKALDQSDRL